MSKTVILSASAEKVINNFNSGARSSLISPFAIFAAVFTALVFLFIVFSVPKIFKAVKKRELNSNPSLYKKTLERYTAKDYTPGDKLKEGKVTPLELGVSYALYPHKLYIAAIAELEKAGFLKFNDKYSFSVKRPEANLTAYQEMLIDELTACGEAENTGDGYTSVTFDPASDKFRQVCENLIGSFPGTFRTPEMPKEDRKYLAAAFATVSINNSVTYEGMLGMIEQGTPAPAAYFAYVRNFRKMTGSGSAVNCFEKYSFKAYSLSRSATSESTDDKKK